MKHSQPGITIALAVLLAATMILIGRLITPAQQRMQPSLPPRITSLTPGAQIAYLTNVGVDRAEITMATVGDNGFIRQSTPQRLSFASVMPRIDIANNGALLVSESNSGNPIATVRNLVDYNVQLTLSNCQFTALSPNGRTVACSNGREVMVSPTNRLQWSSVRGTLADTSFGAPRLFNETIIVRHAINANTVEVIVVSLVNNATLGFLDPHKHYIFNRAGTRAVIFEGRNLRLFNFVTQEPSAYYALPDTLADVRVHPVALSDRADRVLLHVEEPNGSATQMIVWEFASNELTWLSPVEVTGRATGDFHPDGTMVTFAIGQSIYVGSLADGSTYWVGRGINPVWIVR